MQIGAVIDDRFRIVSRHGSGGNAAVFRAMDLRDERLVLLKFVEASEESEQRWRREALALESVVHRGLPSLIAAGSLESRWLYTAMTLFEGRTLREALRGPMAAHELRMFALAVCEPLAALHRAGIVHRDIKPEHIVLREDEPSASVGLVDLGLCSTIGQQRELTSGRIIGTLGYLPPEQLAAPAAGATARWDVFSLGCVLFECATGRPAFGASDPREALARTLVARAPAARALAPSLPIAFAALIEGMLSTRSDERPRDASAVAAALEAIVTEPQTPHADHHHDERYIAVIVALPEQSASSYDTTPMIIASAERASATDDALLPRDAKARSLADGSLLIWLTSATLDRALAVRAIQCAMLLNERANAQRYGVALSEGSTRNGWPTGPAFDRALSLATTAMTGSVAVDPIAALYADGAMPLEAQGESFVVRAKVTVD